MKISLHITPHALGNISLENKTVVVIDVLRAVTTICTALAHGARAIIPARDAGHAAQLWGKLRDEQVVLAGERNGFRIEGFAYGNSPLEFVSSETKGRTIVLSTTNSTPVFHRLAQGDLIAGCAFVNLSAVANHLRKIENELLIVCSGKDGEFSLEDTLCGGMLVDRLSSGTGNSCDLNDASYCAKSLYNGHKDNLKDAVRNSEHGRHLRAIGFEQDVEFAVRIDSIAVVPVLRDGKLVAA